MFKNWVLFDMLLFTYVLYKRKAFIAIEVDSLLEQLSWKRLA